MAEIPTLDEKYTIMPGTDGDCLEFKEVQGVDPHHVWTLVDGDEGGQYAVPGFHFVNRFGYARTAQGWTDENEVLRW